MKFIQAIKSIFYFETGFTQSLLLLSTYALFFLLPWYRFDSGQLQPVDGVIFFAGLLLMLHVKLADLIILFRSRVFLGLVGLLFYLIVRYFIVYFNHNEVYLLFSHFYYAILFIFFTSLFVYLYCHLAEEKFYRVMLSCLLVSAFLPLVTLFIFGPNYGLEELQKADPSICRPVLTFNNANQLGFFGLVNLSLFYYIGLFAKANQIKQNKIISLLIININFVFLLLSVSRAASPAIILYIFSYPLIFQFKIMDKYPKTSWALLGMLVIAWFSVIYVLHHTLLINTHAAHIPSQRFVDDFYFRTLKGISYNFNSVSLFLFGNGSLFSPARTDHMEFHNNFLSIFNQVGLVGLLLYVYLIIEISIGLLKKGMLYILPFLCYLAYSELHYAFRTRMNWLFFAMLVLMFVSVHLSEVRKKSKN